MCAQVIPPAAPAVPSIAPVSMQPVSSISLQSSVTTPQSQAKQPLQMQNSAAPVESGSKKAIQKTLTSEKVSAASLSGLAASLFGGSQNNEVLSLLSGGKGTAGQWGSNTVNPAANLLLEQILVQLGEIQQKISDTPVHAKPASLQVASAGQIAESTAKILRFSVNNYSILDTCRTVFFSKRNKDGNFLLTGDRKYLSDGRTRDETFYMLFKRIGMNSYEIACSVSQDYENPYSFLYQFSQKDAINAQQTGNFITVHTKDPAWKLDILIDISDLGLY